MKRIISAIAAAAVMAASVPVTVSAEKNDDGLPFELGAPSAVGMVWMRGTDTATTMQLTYNMNDSMSSYFAASDAEKAAALDKAGIYELYICAQIDWAIDDPDDWHYNKYWDGKDGRGIGYDENGNYRLGIWDEISAGADAENSVITAWTMRGNVLQKDKMDNPAFSAWWTGSDYVPGLKNQLKKGQYILENVNSNEQVVVIDYNAHTTYSRVRWDVTVKKNKKGNITEQHYFSDWSETAAFGKDAEQSVLYSEDTLAPPVIKGLHLTGEEYEDAPVAAFTLEVPDELSDNITRMAASGGSVSLYTVGRIEGKAEWIDLTNDTEVRSGEYRINLSKLLDEGEKIDDNMDMRLKCSYHCLQFSEKTGDFLSEFETGYSNTLSFKTDDLEKAMSDAAEQSRLEQESRLLAAQSEEVKTVCPLCGSCPVQPMGVCLYVWIGIGAVVLMVLIAIIIAIVTGKDSEGEETEKTEEPDENDAEKSEDTEKTASDDKKQSKKQKE